VGGQHFRRVFAHKRGGFGSGVVRGGPRRVGFERFGSVLGLEVVTSGPVFIDSSCQRGKQESKAVTLSATLGPLYKYIECSVK